MAEMKDFTLRHSHIPAMMKAVSESMREFVAGCLAKRDTRLDAVEKRLAELEARPVGLSYQGTHKAGATYTRHQCVTHRGHVWACRVDSTTETPGRSSDWQMAVRAGENGRDADGVRRPTSSGSN